MTDRELRLIALNLALKAHHGEAMSALFLISEANRIFEFIWGGSQFLDRDKNAPSDAGQGFEQFLSGNAGRPL